MNRVSSKLAARLSTRQLDALSHCDGAGDRADALITQQWDRLMRLLEREGKRRQTSFVASHEFIRQAADIIREMNRLAHSSLHGDLTKIATWGHRSGAAALVQTLPVGYLKDASLQRKNNRTSQAIHSGHFRRLGESNSRAFLEDDTRPTSPGAIALRLGLGGILQPTDASGRLREPVRNQLSDSEQRELFQQLLFPPLSFDRIISILRHPIAGKTWEQDLGDATRLADAHVLLGIISGGFSAGKTPQQVAMLLRPAVQNVKSTAKRVARTYGMQVAHRAQMDAHAEIGEDILGYQIHAVLDENTRSWHSHRAGEVYYLRPQPGQKGPAQMPHPPLEAEDPNERPPGTPHTAWNCRCWLAPIWAPLEALRNHPDFQNADEQLIPDPVTYSQWFSQADESRRKLAVGSRRYSTVANAIDGEPAWEHFVDPQSGALMTAAELRDESDVVRSERIAKVRAAIGERERLTRQVARMGFV